MRILIPLLAACLLTGCTHIGALATTSDGNGVWVATNSTTLFGKEFALHFYTKDLDSKDFACTELENSVYDEQLQ